MHIMEHTPPSPLLLRRCVNAAPVAGDVPDLLCDTVPVATVVVSFPSGFRPDWASFWCAPCLAALDVSASAQLLPSALVVVRAS